MGLKKSVHSDELAAGTLARAFPILCALALFIVMLCLASPLLFHADNATFAHALYINDDASPHWVYPSYLLSVPLCWISGLVPQINVFQVYLYALLVCSAGAVLHVTAFRGGCLSPLGMMGIAVASYIIFWIPMHMEYAWISFAAAGCGCMLLFHSLYEGKWRARQLLLGVFLLLSGAVLRQDSCLGFLPFIGMASIFLLHRGCNAQAWVRCNLRSLVVPAGIIGVIGLLPLIQYFPAECAYQDTGNLIEINKARMAFCDYPDRSGLDKTEAYRAEGIDPACVHLVSGYYYQDSSVMSTDWWKNVLRVRQHANSPYADCMTTLCYAKGVAMNWRILLITMALFTVWGVFIRTGKWRLYPFAIFFAYIVAILVCCAKTRCHETPMMTLTYFCVAMMLVPCGVAKQTGHCIRSSVILGWVVIGVLVCLSVICLFMGGGGFHPESLALFLIPLSLSLGFVIRKYLSAWRFICVAMLFAVTCAAILSTHSERLCAFGGFRHVYADPAGRAALTAWCQAHPDQTFMMDFYAYRALCYPDTALFFPRKPYLPNVLELGNWQSSLPYRKEVRKKLGITNEASCLSKEGARVVLKRESDSRILHLLQYLRDHYGLEITLEKECELTGLYSVYRPVIRKMYCIGK